LTPKPDPNVARDREAVTNRSGAVNHRESRMTVSKSAASVIVG
jgi:hypothetical protein